jgi:phage N-6-adenine-methyltransferase
MNEIHYSSQTDEWATPQDAFNSLHEIHNFTLDPCANEINAKCPKFFTKQNDGLAQSWAGERVFMNPPYGRVIGEWVRKAYEESRNGALVVCLIPARTDTRYWHDYVMRADEVLLVRGRLKFGGSKNSAPFPSAVVVFKPVAQSPQLRLNKALQPTAYSPSFRSCLATLRASSGG